MYGQITNSILLRVVGRSRGLPDAFSTDLEGFWKKYMWKKARTKIPCTARCLTAPSLCFEIVLGQKGLLNKLEKVTLVLGWGTACGLLKMLTVC